MHPEFEGSFMHINNQWDRPNSALHALLGVFLVVLG